MIDYLSPVHYERQYEMRSKPVPDDTQPAATAHEMRLPDRLTSTRSTLPLGYGGHRLRAVQAI